MQIRTPTTSEVHSIQYLSLRQLPRVCIRASELRNGENAFNFCNNSKRARESLVKKKKSQKVEETQWIEVAIITTVQHTVTRLRALASDCDRFGY